jgi:hypothetical protein
VRPPVTTGRTLTQLFLRLLFVWATRAAATRGLRAAGFAVSSRPALSLTAALRLIAAIAFLFSHVASSWFYGSNEPRGGAATPMPLLLAHEQEQRAPLALDLECDGWHRVGKRGR